MKSFVDLVKNCHLEKDNVAVFWLGQAGFLIKTADNHCIFIDPYFSNCCERHFGFKRLIPMVIEPSDIVPDVLLVSHAHFDHLDIDSIDEMVGADKTKIWAANDTKEFLEKYNLDSSRLKYLSIGDNASLEEINVKAVKCDHGDLAPDALGFLIEIYGKKIYFTGDTAFREDYFANPELKGVDLLIAPINGAFGNLNEHEAVNAFKIIEPKMMVPCHFWNFAEHGGNPMIFKEEMEKENLSDRYCLLSVYGEPLII